MADRDLEDLVELLEELVSTMKHAEIFIRSRQIMHPEGQRQYAECLVLLERLTARAIKRTEQLAERPDSGAH